MKHVRPRRKGYLSLPYYVKREGIYVTPGCLCATLSAYPAYLHIWGTDREELHCDKLTDMGAYTVVELVCVPGPGRSAGGRA